MPPTSRTMVSLAAVMVGAAVVVLVVFASGPERDGPPALPIEQQPGRQPEPPASASVPPVRVQAPLPVEPATTMEASDEPAPPPEPVPAMPTIEPRVLAAAIGEAAAAEVVAAMAQHWRIFRPLFQGRTDSHALKADYVFAIWPRLGELLEQKRATAEAWAVGPAAPPTAAPGYVNYGFDVTQQVLTVSFQTPGWRTTISFTAASRDAASFERIRQVTEAELAGRK